MENINDCEIRIIKMDETTVSKQWIAWTKDGKEIVVKEDRIPVQFINECKVYYDSLDSVAQGPITKPVEVIE